MDQENVVLLDCWASAYAMRVRIALAEKGVKYESREENLADNLKSALLLESNPIHKKVPVLIHNGKPICESINIVEYIDEIWTHKPLLPSHPYERAQAKFWADYINNKIYENGHKMWKVKGDEQKTLKKEFIESLKTLERELDDKPYFGGDNFGFIDLALIPITVWFYSFEICADFSVESECPKFVEWIKRCMEIESVAKSLPDHKKIYEYLLYLKEKYGI